MRSRICAVAAVLVGVAMLIPAAAGSGLNSGGIINCPPVGNCKGSSRADIINVNRFAGPVLVDGRGGNDIINGIGNGATLKGGFGYDIINGGPGDYILAKDMRSDTITCNFSHLISSDRNEQVRGTCIP